MRLVKSRERRNFEKIGRDIGKVPGSGGEFREEIFWSRQIIVW